MPASKGRSQAASSESTTPSIPPPETLPQSSAASKHVSIACEACRQGRSKCSGEAPCWSYVRRKIKCAYTKSEDGRRKSARKRKVEDLENDSTLLNDLIHTVQQSDDEQIAQVIALIRSNPSLEEVKTYVGQQLATIRVSQRETSPELEDLRKKIDALQRKRFEDLDTHNLQQQDGIRALDIARLTDSPPWRVPASPWTRVTTDDTLVSHLVSALLTWDRHLYNWVDEAPFLRDMQKGKLESSYCSPFLVNALLGYACAYAEYDEAKLKRGAPSKLMTRFVEEATRLLEEDNNEASLATVEGLAYLYMAIGITGNDGGAYKYLKRAGALCRDLENKFKNLQSDNAPASQLTFSRALDITCWGIFNVLTMISVFYQDPLEQPQPTRRLIPYLTVSRERALYPRIGVLVSWQTAELQYYYSTLSLITRDISRFLCRKSSNQEDMPCKDVTEEIYELHVRLLQWRADLPEHLQMSDQSLPEVLTQQSYYVSLVMMICAPLIQKGAVLPKSHLARVQTIRKEAAIAAVRICRIHQSLYDTTYMDSFMIQPVLLALNCLVYETDRLMFGREITDLCIFFRAMSRRFPFAMAALRMLRARAEQSEKTRPPETEALFEAFDSNDWAKRQMKQITSLYPVIGDISEAGLENMKMTDFLDTMEKLEIDGH